MGVNPGQLVDHALLPVGAHLGAHLRVVEKDVDFLCKLTDVIGPGIERSAPGRIVDLLEIKGDDRPGEDHVFEDLVHGRVVGPLRPGIGVDADICGGEIAGQFVVTDPSGEMEVAGHPHLRAHFFQLLDRGAAADQDKADIMPVQGLVQIMGRTQQIIDPILLAHLAEIADQVGAALPQLRIGLDRMELVHIRTGAHNKDILRFFMAALQGDIAVGFIGNQDHPGGLESQFFEQKQCMVEQSAPPVKFGRKHLGGKVMMIKDELLANQLVEQAEEKVSVGRIAGLQHVKALPAQHPE